MKWSEIVPATYPSVTFNVDSTTGARYAYGASNAGTMYRLENGATWDGTAIAHTITTGEFFPAGMWSFSEISKIKFAAKSFGAAGEDRDVTITHYADGVASSPTLTVALDQTASVARNRATADKVGKNAYAHQVKFTCSTSTDTFEPLVWGYAAQHVRED